MTIFVIKIIAYISMFLDHIKYGIPQTRNFLTIYFGRIAFPLFAFLLTEGYAHTSNLNKYKNRLIIFALISQIPFMLFRSLVGDWKMLNIMFTLLLGLLSICVYDKFEKKDSIPLCVAIIVLGEILKVDYGWYGVALILIMHIFKQKKVFLTISYVILVIIYYFYSGINILKKIYLWYFICTCLPLICILLYNGKKGKKLNYFYYYFYPVHMLLIYIINFIFIK